MCGLVGMAGKLETSDEMILKRMLVLDVFRGFDSTGLAAIRGTNNEVKIAKAAVNPIELFDMGRFKDALNGWQSKVFIGHNRAATKGAVNGANAHPFQYDHIVGAHNGTLDHMSWKKLEELCGETTDVDSQAIFMAIAKLGIDETMKHMSGAWALVWYDLSDNTLNFLRNDKRPFWYSYSKNGQKLLWASEWPIMRAATDLSATKFETLQDKEGYVYFPTDVDVHYKYDVEALKKNANDERPKPTVRTLKGKEPVVAAKAGGNVHPFHRAAQKTSSTNSTTTSPGTTGILVDGIENSSDVKHLVGSKNRPLGGYMTKDEFEKLAKYGCSWCSEDVFFDDPGVTIIENTESVLCPSCALNEGHHSHIFVKPEYISGAVCK